MNAGGELATSVIKNGGKYIYRTASPVANGHLFPEIYINYKWHRRCLLVNKDNNINTVN